MTQSIIPMETKQSPTVAVWTPWGVQSVPKQELKPSAMKRLAGHLGSLPKLQAGRLSGPELSQSSLAGS